MKLELEILESLCDTKVFSINEVEANWQDFGDKYDTDWENSDDYACGNMEFIPKLPAQEILEKYGINNSEYLEVQVKLGALSFGSCGLCV